MNFRHATALALVVWYLLMPPEVRDKKGNPVIAEPGISQWNTLAIFDSAMSCHELQNHLLDRARQELIQHYHASGTSSESLAKSAMDRATTPKEIDQIEVILLKLRTSCVASNDPRFNPKPKKQ